MTTGAAVVTTAGIAETAADSGSGRIENHFFRTWRQEGDHPPSCRSELTVQVVADPVTPFRG